MATYAENVPFNYYYMLDYLFLFLFFTSMFLIFGPYSDENRVKVSSIILARISVYALGGVLNLKKWSYPPLTPSTPRTYTKQLIMNIIPYSSKSYG